MAVLILNCSGLPGRTSLRQVAPRLLNLVVRLLFRSSRPDFIETFSELGKRRHSRDGLFRSSRPDFIETWAARPVAAWRGVLFRSSRPDFIETQGQHPRPWWSRYHCSGLPGRTSLRRSAMGSRNVNTMVHCSGLPGRTSLRPVISRRSFTAGGSNCSGLPGRTSLRPGKMQQPDTFSIQPIVPVFQAGLH